VVHFPVLGRLPHPSSNVGNASSSPKMSLYHVVSSITTFFSWCCGAFQRWWFGFSPVGFFSLFFFFSPFKITIRPSLLLIFQFQFLFLLFLVFVLGTFIKVLFVFNFIFQFQFFIYYFFIGPYFFNYFWTFC